MNLCSRKRFIREGAKILKLNSDADFSKSVNQFSLKNVTKTYAKIHVLSLQHIHELQEELRKALDDKKELSRRVNELSKIRQNLKDKVGQMEKQQEILLKNNDGKKVSELLGYVEKQRNVYRSNIKQLLNKLDPDGRALGRSFGKNQQCCSYLNLLFCNQKVFNWLCIADKFCTCHSFFRIGFHESLSKAKIPMESMSHYFEKKLLFIDSFP